MDQLRSHHPTHRNVWHRTCQSDSPVNATLDADGSLHAVINSLSDSVHSGFLGASLQDQLFHPQTPLAVNRFRVTFTHAGTYPYICALHDILGMKGKVVVLP